MVQWVHNKLIQAVDTHHSDGFKGVFYSLMVSVPWYLGWQQQKVARKARARLNGALIWVETVLLHFHMAYKTSQVHQAMANACGARDHKTVMSNLSIN